MRYQEPSLEIILFIGDDVITTSPNLQDKPVGGNNEGGSFGDYFG